MRKFLFRLFHKKRDAFSLTELVMAMFLMTFVVFLAGALINLASTGFVGSEVQMTIINEDTAFASKLNESIQKSTVGFTVPYQSFNNTGKLTEGWNYLGVMDDVHIPRAASRTGKEIDSAQALVYIEYAGKSVPARVPSDCNLIQNGDGYFLQKVLGHAFKDKMGVEHDYTLVFHPTNPTNSAAQTVIYDFTSNANYENGQPVGDGKYLDIDTMLSCLNAIQVVYKGSASNPAVALAFRSDFMPTWADQAVSTTKPSATVVMVLDTSGSMSSNFGGKQRIVALRENAKKLVEDLSKNENINVIIVPFAWYGNSGYSDKTFAYNLGTQKDACLRRINGLRASGNTNLGDGMRVGYHEFQKLKNSGANVGSVFLMLMTDGEMNTFSFLESGSTKYLYMGSSLNGATNYTSMWSANLTPGFHNDTNSVFKYGIVTKAARDFASAWGTKWVNDVALSKTYLLSLSNGMSSADKAVLEGVFGTDAIDINNLTDFQTVFEDIGSNIEEVMWAFEGPRL